MTVPGSEISCGGAHHVRAGGCAAVEMARWVAGIARRQHQVDIWQLVVPSDVQQKQLNVAVKLCIAS